MNVERVREWIYAWDYILGYYPTLPLPCSLAFWLRNRIYLFLTRSNLSTYETLHFCSFITQVTKCFIITQQTIVSQISCTVAPTTMWFMNILWAEHVLSLHILSKLNKMENKVVGKNIILRRNSLRLNNIFKFLVSTKLFPKKECGTPKPLNTKWQQSRLDLEKISQCDLFEWKYSSARLKRIRGLLNFLNDKYVFRSNQ